jgi:hypothetical protein
VNNEFSLEQRTVWAFWLACGIAAVGGVVPLLLAGTSGRVSGVIIPLWAAAIAFGACSVLQGRGRPAATGLYFVAGLAIVYGILAMLAVQLRLAVVGTCPPTPEQCAIGLERPLSGAENTGLGFAAGFGIVAVLVGFFGLVTLYRRLNGGPMATPRGRRILPFGASSTPEPAPQPPVRRIPPVTHSSAPKSPAVAAAPEPPPASQGAVIQVPELSAPEPPLELPAPAPELDLPAPASGPDLPAHLDASQAPETAPAPAASTRPRRKRAPKTPIDPTPLASSDT